MHGECMKKLKFKLISNEIVMINTSVSYFIIDNCLKFKIDDTLYEYHLDEDYLFKRDKELLIKINSHTKNIEIELAKEGYKFALNINNIVITKTNNSIKFMYTFDSDEETTNCIYIDY